MPVKIGTLLHNLAKKAGFDTTLLAIPAESFEVPDELVAALDSKLFTEDAAKNNPALKTYFKSQALDAIDKTVLSLFDEFEFDEDSKTEISGIKSTYERIPALAKKIKDLESQKANSGKGDKVVLQEQINKLNQEKAALIAAKDKEILDIRADSSRQVTDFMIKSAISSANLITDTFDKEVVMDLAYTFLNKELTAQGARAINKDGALKLVQASDEALNFYSNNKEVSVNEFIDSALAKHKLIAVNTKPAGTASGTTTQQSQTTTTPATAANSSFQALLAQSKADVASMS